jgi:hypothetical protein
MTIYEETPGCAATVRVHRGRCGKHSGNGSGTVARANRLDHRRHPFLMHTTKAPKATRTVAFYLLWLAPIGLNSKKRYNKKQPAFGTRRSNNKRNIMPNAQNSQIPSKKSPLTIGAIALLLVGVAIGYAIGQDRGYKKATLQNISSYEECAAAGYPIMESYPEQCATPDNRTFVREIEDDAFPPQPIAPPNGSGGRGNGEVYCTQDAKLCPDGSYVGRTGPNCEFSPCPGAVEE